MRPMMPRGGSVRGALPALLVMVLIAGAGYLFATAVREALPDDFLEPAPYEGLAPEDIDIDPATGLPIVPTTLFDEVVTWTPAQPNSRIVAANRWSSDVPGDTADRQLPTVTLMATYPTFEEAVAVGQDLASVVGDPEAEIDWLESAGVPSGDGFEWVGPERSTTPFVQVVDRRLLVDGLVWREAYEPQPNEESDESQPGEESDEPASYGAPLAQALQASASSLLVEGDRGGEGAIAFDLVCVGGERELLTLGQELADAPYARPARPPWIDPPLTDDERNARRTERLVTQLRAAAFVRQVMGSDEVEQLSDELSEAVERGDEAAISASSAALQAYFAERVPAELGDLGPLADAIDGEQMARTMAELVRRDAGADGASPAADESGAPELPGASARVDGSRDGSADYEVLVDGRRLWLTLGSWRGIAQGFGPFVGYLDANGCDDIQVVFHDAAVVRGDRASDAPTDA